MQINLNSDIVQWLDAVRGDKSRSAYIVAQLRTLMQYPNLTKDLENEETNHAYGIGQPVNKISE